jgi:hypothetical protein
MTVPIELKTGINFCVWKHMCVLWLRYQTVASLETLEGITNGQTRTLDIPDVDRVPRTANSHPPTFPEATCTMYVCTKFSISKVSVILSKQFLSLIEKESPLLMHFVWNKILVNLQFDVSRCECYGSHPPAVHNRKRAGKFPEDLKTDIVFLVKL